ncbi:oligoendopeptidase F [bacterium]|nr:oligoendopeptidase F [bacterium]
MDETEPLDRLQETLMKRLFVLTLVFALLGTPVFAEETAEVLYFENRADIPVAYTWNLEDIFPSVEAFNDAYRSVEDQLPRLEALKGTAGQSPDALRKVLDTYFAVQEQFAELLVYANQYFDSNRKDADAAELAGRTDALQARISRATAWIDPEISQIEATTLQDWMRTEALETFSHYLDNLLRMKPHIRSGEVEQVIANANLLANAPKSAWGQLVNADIEWPTVINEEGEEATATPALYYSFVSSQERRVRKEAALKMFGTYKQFANTMAATRGGHIARDKFYADTRGYDSTVEMALDQVNVPYDVIETLIATVHDNLDAVHQYAALRKKVLDVNEFHVYDLYVNLVPEGEKKVTYEEAKELALDFWKTTYGDEYYQVGKKAFEERWIDVYAGEGKRGGAYSWGTFNSHPYMLLNWGGTLEDVFTLVHEMGHSVHTYLANQNQPFHNADYSLFVAEVAAVTSEALFLEYMLERETDPMVRLSLMNSYINNITGTFLRQIFFTEFELAAHQLVQDGKPATAKAFGDIYADLWTMYYGPDLVLDEEFHAGWARVSHFYRTFYVYVYASSFAAGEAIAQRFRDGDKGAVTDYLEMLKLGGSVYPMDALRIAGVDMTDKEVIRTVMRRYDETLSEMEKLLLK